MTAPQPPSEWVWLARIRRPQGRKGEVFAALLTDFPEKFAERRQVWLLPGSAAELGTPSGTHPGTRHTKPAHREPRQVELAHHWLHKGGIVLHFAGVDSIGAAEELKGAIVAVPQAQRAALNEDEAYIGDLIGCALIDVSSATPTLVGPIDDVDRTAGPTPLLVVRAAKGEVLIPFAKAYLRKLDLAARRVEMELPEGLINLNDTDKA